jgi:hypothetical protein
MYEPCTLAARLVSTTSRQVLPWGTAAGLREMLASSGTGVGDGVGVSVGVGVAVTVAVGVGVAVAVGLAVGLGVTVAVGAIRGAAMEQAVNVNVISSANAFATKAAARLQRPILAMGQCRPCLWLMVSSSQWWPSRSTHLLLPRGVVRVGPGARPGRMSRLH